VDELRELAFAVADDPIARLARGALAAASLEDALAEAPRLAHLLDERGGTATTAMVSTLPYHEAGADAADELALALSAAVRVFAAMDRGGQRVAQAAARVAFQVAVGHDTFGELAKLRALTLLHAKLLVAYGVSSSPRPLVHAVCSARTLAQRDPWVNMLRVTTQVFAAVLGGADLVTPLPFDGALGAASALGRRVARSTGLVLREESHLGRVTDPAAGAYALEARTDALAREAWKRFQALESEGGVVAALASGRLLERLERSWQARLVELCKRRAPILGVSDFANLDEVLPASAGERARAGEVAPASAAGALPRRRDAAPFEALRDRADAASSRPEAVLVTLGSFAESRARVGFAAGLLAAGGIRSRESTGVAGVGSARVACLCGTDERYAAEAASVARALTAAGVTRVLLAGRPGALEASLREAGVDAFVFVGCDAVAVLDAVLDTITGDEETTR